MTRKVTLSLSAATVKQAERRPKIRRSSVPSMSVPPTDTVSTRPEPFSAAAPNHLSGVPDSFSSGCAASSFSFASAAVKVTVL